MTTREAFDRHLRHELDGDLVHTFYAHAPSQAVDDKS